MSFTNMAAQRAAGTSPLAMKKFLEFGTPFSERNNNTPYKVPGNAFFLW